MILSFSQLGKYGRLGNQLFQIHSALGLAEKHNAQVAFPAWDYESYFDSPLIHSEMQAKRVSERHYHYHDWNLTESCDLFGYLQSEKYFGSARLKFKPSFLDAQRAKHAELFSREVICIHIRRGDMVGNPNYYQLPPTYYLHALLTHFPAWRGQHILFISDDIAYCKLHFECLPNAFFAQGTDIEDMALASQCQHFILSNSSFGWWCAYFGEKPNSKVVHPGHLFDGKLSLNDARDYYPERWIRHYRDEYKLDLSDVTFTIPLHFDHISRKENLDLSLGYLQAAFYANYLFMEQGANRQFDYTQQWGKYTYVNYPYFHRTKMLNEMANQSYTPYLVNWDCDIFIPPAQLYLMAESLRQGADMVFPYDGRFARMPRTEWLNRLQSHTDIGVTAATVFKGQEPDHNSVGGAVAWNKRAFYEGGMENENFISFGPEDCERHDRFKKLGYNIRRIPGCLFHLNHHVGVNSSPRNPHFQHNQAELEKIRRSTEQELRNYINTWPWRQIHTVESVKEKA